MTLCFLAVLLVPVLLNAQTTTTPKYTDGILSPGAPDDAASIDNKEKLKISGARVIAPRVLIATALVAGVEQVQNSPGKWGRGADGYGKRHGTYAAQTAIRQLFAFGVDSAFHLDPRFFRAPESMSTGGRLKHALAQVVIAHTDTGGRSFAFGSVLGTFAAGEAGTLWEPRRSDGRFGDGLVFAGFVFAGDAAQNVVREFWPDVRKRFQHNKP